MTVVDLKCYVEVYINEDNVIDDYFQCSGTVEQYDEYDYGSDADGNRGVKKSFIDEPEPDLEELESAIEDLYPDYETYNIWRCEIL